MAVPAGPRVVFSHVDATDEGFETAARDLLPHAQFRPGKVLPLGPAVYVAHAPEHLALYETWFPGLGVRVRACLSHRPRDPDSALFLPVTYDSWVVAIEGPRALGAALEAAALLRARTAVVPAFDVGSVDAVRAGLAQPYRRWHDRIVPAAFKDRD